MDGQTGVDAQQTLEDMGLTVEIQKEYSELNDDGTPVTDPGYAVSTTPAAGNSVSVEAWTMETEGRFQVLSE